MKIVCFSFVALAFVLLGCSNNEDECRRCTGTVTNTGQMADWTVCDNAGNIIRVNNISEEAELTSNTLPEAVAFFESIGLECN